MVDMIWLVFCSLIAVFSCTNRPSLYLNSSSDLELSASLSGSFDVNSNGAATYCIDITLPPGTNRVAPQLSIVYNSQSGCGILGQGMSLTGIPSITRTGATYQQDGFKGGVNYDDNDKLQIGSNRLIKINGDTNYLASGSIYHTEIQSWSKITAQGNCGVGPCGFTVVKKSGDTLFFGSTQDSRAYAQGPSILNSSKNGSVRSWYLSKQQDLNGNIVSYTYTEQPKDIGGNILPNTQNKGQIYPDKIYYTSNPRIGLNNQRIVEFFYESRNDSTALYQGGGIIQATARMTNITTSVINIHGDTVPVNNYLFKYDTDSPLQISRISTISLFGSTGKLYAQDSFVWSNGPNQMKNSRYAFAGDQTSSGWTGDFNADGKTDILTMQSETGPVVAINYAEHGGFRWDTITPSIDLYDFQFVADFNGDGRTDFFNGEATRAYLYISTGSEFRIDTVNVNNIYWPVLPSSCPTCFYCADFNGDGKSDFLTRSGEEAYISFSTGSDFTPYSSFSFIALDVGNNYISDFNGDGLMDILAAGVDSIFLSDWSRGDGFSAPIYTGINFSEVTSNFFADFNGDHLSDLVVLSGQDYQLYLSNGAGLENGISLGTQALSGQERWLSDFNGDGYVDFLNGVNTSFEIYLGTGFDFETKSLPDLILSTMKVWLGDFNGDGMADLFNANLDSIVSASESSMGSQQVSNLPNMLMSISNGLGGMIQMEYLPISNDSIYSKFPGKKYDGVSFLGRGIFNVYNPISSSFIQGSNYPIRITQNGLYVISGFSEFDGTGREYSYRYHYSGAKMDILGTGWLGFKEINHVDSSAKNKSSVLFHQLFPLTGKVDSTTKFSFEDQVIGSKKSLYKVYPTPVPAQANTVYTVNQTGTNSFQYDYGTYLFPLITEYKYDVFGNKRLTIQKGDITAEDTVIYTINTYINDTANWRLGYLDSTTVALDSFGKSVLQQEINIYDPSMNIVQKDYWNDQNKTYNSHQYRYDQVGNMTHSIDFANDTTAIIYDSVYHSFPKYLIRPPNQWGKRLITRMHHNPKFGKIERLADANHNQRFWSFDGIGRDSQLYLLTNANDSFLISKTFYYPGEDLGTLVKSIRLLNWNQSEWSTSWYSTDGLGRTILKGKERSDHTDIFKLYSYNSNDQLTHESIPFFEGQDPYWIIKSYDPYSRLIKMNIPINRNEMHTNVISYGNKSMKITEAYDTKDSSHLTLTFNYYNGQPKVVNQINNNQTIQYYGYDALGRPTSATDPLMNKYSSKFNSLGQTIFQSNPSIGFVEYFFDFQNRCQISINTSGDSTIKKFDALGRLLSQEYPDGQTINYFYDLENHHNSQGELSAVNMPHGDEYGFTYNVFRQIDTARSLINGNEYLEVMTYNPDKSPLTFQYINGTQAIYQYYTDGLLQSIKLDDVNKTAREVVTIDSYNASNRILQKSFSNGVVSFYKFTPVNEVDSMLVYLQGSSPFLAQSYKRNYAGAIMTIGDLTDSNNNQNFKYYPSGELQTASGPFGNQNFNYDEAGNIKSIDSINFENEGFQMKFGTQNLDTIIELTYDSLGRMRTKKLIDQKVNEYRYTYNYQGLLDSVSRNDTLLLTMGYNFKGFRIWKKNHLKNFTETIISPKSQTKTNANGQIINQSRNIFTSSGLVASIITSWPNTDSVSNDTIYYHQNYLNNTLAITNSNGKELSWITYEPYGGIWDLEGQDVAKYKYGGKEFDEESGLYYFNFRYFDPSIGRFITPDNQLGGPVFSYGALNNYSYTLNNPINFNDPTGHGILSDAEIGIILSTELLSTILTEGSDIPAEVALNEELLQKGIEDVGQEGLSSLLEQNEESLSDKIERYKQLKNDRITQLFQKDNLKFITKEEGRKPSLYFDDGEIHGRIRQSHHEGGAAVEFGYKSHQYFLDSKEHAYMKALKKKDLLYNFFKVQDDYERRLNSYKELKEGSRLYEFHTGRYRSAIHGHYIFGSHRSGGVINLDTEEYTQEAINAMLAQILNQ